MKWHLPCFAGRGLQRAAFVVALILSPTVSSATDATGTWRTEATDQGHVEVEMRPCGAALCGTIVRARDPAGQEQPYAHTGKLMVWDMVDDGTGKWANGRIWDPRNDRTFRSRMELDGTALRVSGCVLGICQAQTWRRVQ